MRSKIQTSFHFEPQAKACPRCGETLPIADFNKQGAWSRKSMCRNCEKTYYKAAYKARKTQTTPDAAICEEGFKTCSNCKIDKQFIDFGKRGKAIDGRNPNSLQAWCKDCLAEATRTYRKANKVYKTPRPEIPKGSHFCTKCRAIKTQDCFHNSYVTGTQKKFRCKQCEREIRILRVYKMTSDQFDQLFALQGKICGLCGSDHPKTKSGLWCIDHDHKTDEVRGILCNSCNALLGFLEDNIDTAESIPDYLLNPPARLFLGSLPSRSESVQIPDFFQSLSELYSVN